MNESYTDGDLTVGVDGNCGFALLGANLQEGVACFVECEKPTYFSQASAAVWKALEELKAKTGRNDLKMPACGKCDECDSPTYFAYHDCDC